MNNELLLESCERLIKSNRCTQHVVNYYRELTDTEVASTNIGGTKFITPRLLLNIFRKLVTLLLLMLIFIYPAKILFNTSSDEMSVVLECLWTGATVGFIATFLYYFTRLGSFLTRLHPIKLDYTISNEYIDFIVRRGYVKVEEKELCLEEREMMNKN